MKILFISSDYHERAPGYTFQVADAFRRLGHKVEYFFYRKMQLHRTSITKKIMNRNLQKVIKKVKADIIFTIKGESIMPGVIRKAEATTVNWVLDDPFAAGYNKVDNIGEYDYFFSFESKFIPRIKKAGAKHVYFLPCAASPKVHYPIIPLKKRKYKYDVTFQGSHSDRRETILKKLDVKINGFRWANSGLDIVQGVWQGNKNVIDREAISRFFNNSKINLNIHNEHAISDGINLRVFECILTKSFILTDYLPGMEKMFKIGKELAVYKNEEDLKKKIDYYLKNPKERKNIIEKGYKRVLKEHTMEIRMKKMLSYLT